MHRLPLIPVFVALGATTVLLLLLSLMLGSVHVEPAAVWHVVWGSEPSLARDVIMDLRLPRALTAFAVGGLLGLAGALLQVLLRNPLADPYVLGVSGGASVTALLALMAGMSAVMVDAAAGAGALAACALVFALAQGRGGWTPTRLLLTGVVVAAGAGSIVSLLLAMSDDTRLRGMVFWLLGDLTRGDRWGWLLTLLAAATLLCVALGRPLNVLARGETIAATVGLDVRRVRSVVFVLSSLLTGCAVSTAGSIGFVGLVTPHLVRLALGNDQRIVLAGSALLGGLVLMTADLASRLLLAPRQLPVGALTALVGVPIFLLLMLRQRS
ncbi:MAG: iron ABC transporter permease [Gammaproteobacteria bacterium]|nr:iron ABC transporter permease [Gammaproteobacteria bacterium]MDH4312053.1 iron ABC transporter permease [Gammaproteobacteria bacterium]MDH5273890.1 iron ABC transporter permease [Gammaproteobacteria bacterium]